jgi:ATP-dependent Clp protease ATP-binding subunit ClpC
VGKTAIVEGLAQRIISNDVPEILATPLVVLDLAMMVAGTKYRGQFEERIKAVMNEVRRAEERDPVHRRAAHAGRRRRRRRRDRRVQRAQARAGARRDPVHRRDDLRRVPQVHREGRRARASLPDRSPSSRPARSRRSRSSRACATSTRRTTASRSPTSDRAAVELSRPLHHRRVQPDKSIDVIDEAGARVRLKLDDQAAGPGRARGATSSG